MPAAVTAYLTRFKGLSRQHSASDLAVFTTWCADRGLNPLTVQRGHLELYVRWLQETRHYKASTVSRRLSVVAGFYRTSVIDGVLEHSPAEYVRRPRVPSSRSSACSGCGSSKPLRVTGKGGRITLVPLPPAVGRAVERAIADRRDGPLLLNTRARRLDRHAATRRLHRLAETAGVQLPRMHPHMVRHTYVTTMLDAGVDLRDVQPPPDTPTPAPPCATTEPAKTSTATPTTSSPPTCPPAPNQPHGRAKIRSCR